MADELIRLDTTIVGINVLITKAETAEEANGLFKAKDVIYSQQRYFTDAKPVKRGKLEERIGYGGWGDTYYHCSVCGSDWVFEEGTPKANEWNFCPHCGADVRGDENG